MVVVFAALFNFIPKIFLHKQNKQLSAHLDYFGYAFYVTIIVGHAIFELKPIDTS
jgi:hypothetical protein